MGRRIILALLLTAAALSIAAAAATGIAVRSAAESELESLALDRARQTAAVFGAAAGSTAPGGDPVGSLETLELARNIADRMSADSDTRLVLVGRDGTLLATAGLPENQASLLLENPELTPALPTGTRPGSRTATTRYADRVWAAVPLDRNAATWSEGSVLLGIPDSALAGGTTRAWTIPLLVGLLSLIPIGLYARSTARALREPLAHLSTMAERLEEGDLSYRVGAQRRDEVGDVGRAFNAAAEQIQTQVETLADAQEQARRVLSAMTDGVLVLDEQGRVRNANAAAARILDADRSRLIDRPLVHSVRAFPGVSLMERALAADTPVADHVELPGGRHLLAQAIPLSPVPGRQRQTLVVFRDETDRIRTDRMRRDFVTNVSHELKTPLSGLSLLADTLQEVAEEDPESARRFAERLSTELERLNDLADDLLTLSRLEETRAMESAHPEPIDLSDMARDIVADMQPRALENGQTLEITADDAAPIRGDHVELETMIRNLLDNALRYTDKGGRISVEVAVEHEPADEHFPHGRAYVTVADTGIGIPRDDLSRIFERFYRVDKARSRETGGTGLGLSIVRHVAERHGGSVNVRSTVGVGSTFVVKLPLAAF